MATCPKCKSTVQNQAKKCHSCGTPLSPVGDSHGTLVPELAFDIEKGSLPPAASVPGTASPSVTERPAASGTLNPDNLFAGAERATAERQNSGMTNDSAATAASQAEIGSEDGYAQTIASQDVPDQSSVHADKDARTMQYSQGEVRSALGFSESGTAGRLNRVWEAAIGSTGKGSKQSLRFAREEASDSVFRRVARRYVADANSPSSDGVDYQVRNKLGEGGMGIVFSAVQTAVNRTVALKTLRKTEEATLARQRDPKAYEASRRKQFFYEAEITAELDHPNIPPIYELGVADDEIMFFTMKLIQGTEWEEVISKKSREENLEILEKMMDAVAFAHSKNIINRDLKPGNVMLGQYGEAYVTDWGLAVNLNEGKQPGFGGTPDYMAPEMAMYPEMAAERGLKVSKASDIYLLGAILFQILHGTPPHVGKEQRARLRAAVENSIAETSSEDPLMAIALRAMETQPEDRFESVEEMRGAIREVLKHAESISLAQRSEELLEQAIKAKDYDRFTRSVFGFRDALDLWKGNREAEMGLRKARLAYGQCAFDKGDYDLALQTLDRSIAEEAALYDRAQSAKLAVQQREQRFRRLRRSFVAALIAFLAVSLSLAGYAWNQKNVALSARDAEQQEKNKAIEAQNKALEAQRDAENSAMAARLAEENEKRERMAAQLAQRAAEEAQVKAEKAAKAEQLAKEKEQEEKQKALAAAEAEKKAREAELLAKLEAQQNAAKIQIDDARAKLSLARLQLDQFDIRGATQSLLDVLHVGAPASTATPNGHDAGLFAGRAPSFDTWASRRVELLSNADLPIRPLQSQIGTISFAAGQNVGIVGTLNGKLHLMRHENGQLAITKSHDFGNVGSTVVHAVAMSPDGKEAAIAVDVEGKGHIFVWPLQEAKPIHVPFTGSRSFRGLAYSPDGQRLLAGINSGIWMFKRPNDKWYNSPSQDNVERIEKSQGILSVLQWIDANTALAVASLNGKAVLYHLDFSAAKNPYSQLIDLPAQIPAEDVTAVAHLAGGSQLMVGRTDGSLFITQLNPVQSNDKRRSLSISSEMPKKHRAAVSRIVVHPSGSVLTMSDEPVVHLWQRDDSGQWVYDTFLSGVPGSTKESTATVNMAQAAYLSADDIVGVDGQGVAFAWNVSRQKERRQLSRTGNTGNDAYASPVVAVFSRGTKNQAIAVTRDGTVDLWDLRTGKTIQIDGAPQTQTVARWSYFGHTPGAEFVDSVIDPKAGIVVTSASLRNVDRRYLVDPTHSREFCVWDQATGNMVKRWSEAAAESLAPRMSLLNDGRELLIAGENETRIVTTQGQEVFSDKEVGTYFAVPNPRRPNQLAMVKRSGLTWLWDRDHSPLDETRQKLYVSEIKNGYPQKGVWSSDGQRFYVVYTRGDIAVYDVQDTHLALSWSSNRLTSDSAHAALWQATSGAEYPTNSHYDMDVAMSTSGATDRLYINVRDALSKATRQTVLDFNRSESLPILVGARTANEITWLDSLANNIPRYTSSVHAGFTTSRTSTDRILARQRVGQAVYVSTNSARVLKIAAAPVGLTSLGRQTLVSATCDRLGNTLLTAHGDGSIWRLSIDDNHRGTWQRLSYALPNVQRIQLSPDGTQLLAHSAQGIDRLDASTGKRIGEYAGANVAAWDPVKNSEFAVGYGANGRIVSFGADGKSDTKTLELKGGAVLKSLHFFSENWNDPKLAPGRYLAIHTEGPTSGNVHFVSLQDAGPSRLELMEVKKDSILTCSPTDSTIVVGDSSGTVSVWFASPHWERSGQIFDLEGHRGARIEHLVFSSNGEILVTSDSNRRLFGWLSRDSQNRQSKP